MPNLGEESDLAGASTAPALSASDKAGSPSAGDACVYCRRSDRPCKRCIKRNIGHLCHDEPREGQHRKSVKTDTDRAAPEAPLPTSPGNDAATGPGPADAPRPELIPENSIDIRPLSSHASSVPPLGSIQPQPAGVNGSGLPQFSYNEPWLLPQNRFQDIRAFDPSFMFNANEVTDEYNLLGDFLSTSLLDEAGIFSGQDYNGSFNDPSFMNSMAVSFGGNKPGLLPAQMNMHNPLVGQASSALQSGAMPRPASVKPISDMAREKYYMTAADPAGNDPPEDRMNKLLKAKYDAGLLKPFNYVGGYARLNKYMEKHMKHSSRHKILIQLDQFRPKFRERMQSLTDIELVLVEMWFERNLMEYDRVFASMAIPACCWRRTGEIFRGNKEMAELIQVPIESLRDGKLAIHEIIVEDQLVSYWEKFCAICFDQQQKAMLTSCTLRNPNDPDGPDIHCCFSFTIKRDNHNIFSPSAHSAGTCFHPFHDSRLTILKSWKESRHDMADHFYDILMSGQLVTDAERVAKASDLFYEIGTDHFQSAQYEIAVRWLRRGLDLFDINDEALAIPGAEDIKFNIRHTLDLHSDFDSFHASWNTSCSPEVADAILLLLWKQMDCKSILNDLANLRDWCVLALHPLLSQAGEANIGKVQRRLVQCHMAISDYQAARIVLGRMPPSVRQHKLSLFLSCSLALRCQDEMASERALADIVKLGQNEHRLLFASVAETMEYGTKKQAAVLLQRVLDKFNYDLPDDMDLCTMLRCTAQLIISVLTDNPVDIEMLSRLCAVFRAAAACSVKANTGNDQSPSSCPVQECCWFEMTAYNVAVEHIHAWPAKVILDLMAYVDQILYPSAAPPTVLAAKRKLHISTTYIRCILFTTEARRCDADWTIEDIPRTSYSSKDRPVQAALKEHLYRNTFACYATLKQLFDDAAGASKATLGSEILNDLQGKVTDLLPLVFEALFFISNAQGAENGSLDQANLMAVIDRASMMEAGPKVYASFAHTLLSCFLDQDPSDQPEIPLSFALQLLQRVIQAMTRQDDYDSDQAARWIRCVVQIVLDHRDGHEHLSLVQTTVDQALGLARGAVAEVNNKAFHQKAEPKQLYPVEELHWLSSALFNLGIDLYCKPDRQAAQQWMENAVNVADVMAATVSRQDSGDTNVNLSLAKTMRARMAQLGL
ncbi:hypothetical protein DV738_g235, partial [Chaetothyriales sp. CBS 135597]